MTPERPTSIAHTLWTLAIAVLGSVVLLATAVDILRCLWPTLLTIAGIAAAGWVLFLLARWWWHRTHDTTQW